MGSPAPILSLTDKEAKPRGGRRSQPASGTDEHSQLSPSRPPSQTALDLRPQDPAHPREGWGETLCLDTVMVTEPACQGSVELVTVSVSPLPASAAKTPWPRMSLAPVSPASGSEPRVNAQTGPFGADPWLHRDSLVQTEPTALRCGLGAGEGWAPSLLPWPPPPTTLRCMGTPAPAV